ncbi:MAG: hypothetical protein ACKOPM_01515, partial [Novosphingobium sp.]
LCVSHLPMDERGYESSSTPGGFWGCLAASVTGLPLIGIAILAGTLGDCFPDSVDCNHGLPWDLVLEAIGLALVAGFAVRFVVNWLVAKKISKGE